MAFIIGFVSAWFLHGLTYRSNNFSKIMNLRDAYKDSLQQAIDNYGLALQQYGQESDEWKACRSMQTVLQQFDYVGQEIQLCRYTPQLVNNLMDTVSAFLPFIEQQHNKEIINEVLAAISGNDRDRRSINEDMLLLYSVENFLAYQYVAYNCRHSIGISYAELMNYPQKSTIQLGETYSSQLVFSVTDVIGNRDILEIDTNVCANRLKLDGMRYTEKPLSVGHYHHDLILMVPSLFAIKGWTTAIDYDVK